MILYYLIKVIEESDLKLLYFDFITNQRKIKLENIYNTQ